jgi:hypothetical protein
MASEPEIIEQPFYLQITAVTDTPLRNGIMYPQINGETEIQSGTIFAKALVVGSQTWIHNIAWTATDYNTASWSSGTIQLSNGESVAISSGNTGNISAKSYVYFNNTATLQVTTTYSDTVGDEVILLAIVEPDSDTSGFSLITALNAVGTTIDGDKIKTGRISSIDGKTYFDLNDGQLVISDASNPRGLFGKQTGGFP